jgi:hypothetical protein
MVTDQQFIEAFQNWWGDAGTLTIELTPIDVWTLLSAVQLACRHPGFHGPARELAEQAARKLQNLVGVSPILAEVAEMGWDPKHDFIERRSFGDGY